MKRLILLVPLLGVRFSYKTMFQKPRQRNDPPVLGLHGEAIAPGIVLGARPALNLILVPIALLLLDLLFVRLGLSQLVEEAVGQNVVARLVLLDARELALVLGEPAARGSTLRGLTRLIDGGRPAGRRAYELADGTEQDLPIGFGVVEVLGRLFSGPPKTRAGRRAVALPPVRRERARLASQYVGG